MQHVTIRLAIIVILTGSCSKEEASKAPALTDTEPAASAAAPEAREDYSEPAASAAAPEAREDYTARFEPTQHVRVRLLESGQEPKRRLAYARKRTGKLSYEHSVVLDEAISNVSGKGVFVGVLVQGSVTAADSGNGGTRRSFSFDRIQLNDPAGGIGIPQETLDQILPRVKGLSYESAVDPSGVVVDTRLEVPSNAPTGRFESLAKLIAWAFSNADQQVLIPLPKRPVGVGAVWEVIRPETLLGLEFGERYLYKLTALDDDAITASFSLDFAAIPGSRSSTEKYNLGKLVGFAGDGSGSQRIDLRTLAGHGSLKAVLKAGVEKDVESLTGDPLVVHSLLRIEESYEVKEVSHGVTL